MELFCFTTCKSMVTSSVIFLTNKVKSIKNMTVWFFIFSQGTSVVTKQSALKFYTASTDKKKKWTLQKNPKPAIICSLWEVPRNLFGNKFGKSLSKTIYLSLRVSWNIWRVNTIILTLGKNRSLFCVRLWDLCHHFWKYLKQISVFLPWK